MDFRKSLNNFFVPLYYVTHTHIKKYKKNTYVLKEKAPTQAFLGNHTKSTRHYEKRDVNQKSKMTRKLHTTKTSDTQYNTHKVI